MKRKKLHKLAKATATSSALLTFLAGCSIDGDAPTSTLLKLAVIGVVGVIASVGYLALTEESEVRK